MKIIFDEHAGELIDIFDSLSIMCNIDFFKEELRRFQISQEKTVEKALEDLKEDTKLDNDKLNFYFNLESKIIDSIIFEQSPYLWHTSIAEVIEDIRNMSEDKIKMQLIKELSDYKIKDEIKLKEVCSSNSNMLKFIKNLNISSSLKWNLLNFIEDTKYYTNDLADFIEAYVPQYHKRMKKYQKYKDERINYYRDKINKEGINYIKNLGRDVFNYEADFEEVHVSVIFFNSVSFVYEDIADKLYILLGINVEDTFKKFCGDTELENNLLFFKNLSDKTRFGIIRLLSKRDYYGLELAEQLGITTATVSYHMSYLLASKMVHIERKDHKAYYTLDKETFKKSIEFLNKDLNL